MKFAPTIVKNSAKYSSLIMNESMQIYYEQTIMFISTSTVMQQYTDWINATLRRARKSFVGKSAHNLSIASDCKHSLLTKSVVSFQLPFTINGAKLRATETLRESCASKTEPKTNHVVKLRRLQLKTSWRITAEHVRHFDGETGQPADISRTFSKRNSHKTPI